MIKQLSHITREKYFDDNIRKLFSISFGFDRSVEEWIWKYRNNPAGSYSTSAYDGDELVSFVGGYGIEAFYCGNEVAVFQLGDLMTVPRYRNGYITLKNISTFVSAMGTRKKAPFSYGFHSGDARDSGRKRRTFYSESPVGYLQKDFDRKNKQLFKAFSRYTLNEEFSISSLINDCYRDQIKNKNFVLKKNEEYLHWRYLDHPENKYRLFRCSSGYIKKQFCGYLIFREQKDNMYLVDVIFRNKFLEFLAFFISIFEHDYYITRSHGRILTWCSLYSELHEILTKVGFNSHYEPDPLYLSIATTTSELMAQSVDQIFAYTIGDSDMI